MIAAPTLRLRRVIGGTLFRIALEELGAADQWDRIADINGLDDPWLVGFHTILIPPPLTSASGSPSGRQ